VSKNLPALSQLPVFLGGIRAETEVSTQPYWFLCGGAGKIFSGARLSNQNNSRRTYAKPHPCPLCRGNQPGIFCSLAFGMMYTRNRKICRLPLPLSTGSGEKQDGSTPRIANTSPGVLKYFFQCIFF
jgi:hypothetical protein